MIRLSPLLLLMVLLLLTGCSTRHGLPATPRPATSGEKTAASRPKPEPIDLQSVRPNEAGRVMILEYRDIGDSEQRWTRHFDNFRKDLQRLYDLGYRPISLRDYVNNRIDLPAGKSPVVLTFDDGTLGQFRYIYADGKEKVDPNCAVAILEEFHRAHPDWPLEATFYVYYPVPFRQKDSVRRKLEHIVESGMDIGNHTYTHTRLDRESDEGAAAEMARSVAAATKVVPDALVDSIALPYGKGPRNAAVLRSGEHDGVRYTNIAALLVGAEPAPSPISGSFRPHALPRIQAIQTELDSWLGFFKRNPDQRYVSDGDLDTVTVPRDRQADVDQSRLAKGQKLRLY